MNQPNIVLISLDSLRADHLPFYGYSRETAPELASLLNNEKTTLFENAYSTTAWTLPSHASVFTGLHPSEHGIFDETNEIDSRATLPAYLSRTGYDTMAFVNNGWLTRGGITDAFQTRVNIFETVTPSNVFRRNVNRLQMLLSLTDSGATRTLQEFDRRYSELAQPYFVFFHFMEPHYLYNPVRPYNQFYNQRSTIRLLLKQRAIYRHRGKYYDNRIPLHDNHLEGFTDLYDGEINYIDEKLSDLFEHLRSVDDFDDSLIVIFGDHGELFGEDDLIGHHFSLSDSLLHVPLLVKWPSETQLIADSRVSAFVELSDLFKTILELTGLENDTVPEGRTLMRKHEVNCRTAYAEYETPNSLIETFKAQTSDGAFPDHLDTAIRALRKGRYKLVITEDELKLYNLDSQAGEQTDISSSEPDILTNMKEMLDGHTKDVEVKTRTSSEAFSADVKEQLQKLGYL